MRKSNIGMEFQSALMGTGLVQPIDMKVKGGNIDVLCRLVPGQEKPWLSVMNGLLTVSDEMPIGDLHVCRRYVRRNGQMVFGYHIGVSTTSKALRQTLEAFIDVLRKAKPSLAPAAPTTTPQPPSPVASPTQRKIATPELRVVEHRRDEDGNEVIVEEMPLPHVRGEMNRPTHKGGRGATRTASNTR